MQQENKLGYKYETLNPCMTLSQKFQFCFRFHFSPLAENILGLVVQSQLVPILSTNQYTIPSLFATSTTSM